MLPPRPLVGGGARLKAMSAARRSSGLRFKHSAQIVWVGGGQVYDRQAGPGNSRPGLGWLDNFKNQRIQSISPLSEPAQPLYPDRTPAPPLSLSRMEPPHRG